MLHLYTSGRHEVYLISYCQDVIPLLVQDSDRVCFPLTAVLSKQWLKE